MRYTTLPTDNHQNTLSGGHRPIRKSALTLLCTVLTLGVFGSATTPVISAEDLKATRIGWSSIKITESGFDFGGETFIAGAPTDNGWLDWHLVDGQLTPSLSGHLHLNDVRRRSIRVASCIHTSCQHFPSGPQLLLQHGLAKGHGKLHGCNDRNRRERADTCLMIVSAVPRDEIVHPGQKQYRASLL